MINLDEINEIHKEIQKILSISTVFKMKVEKYKDDIIEFENFLKTQIIKNK